ncbi:MAG TPA: (2Fe-2S)-binding protein, partial [Candidatus Sulfotelmatobacter sp.]|nr:(2Fe-2S)-binding protein [Candidatus Sulfotelmatobacter sp.]
FRIAQSFCLSNSGRHPMDDSPDKPAKPDNTEKKPEKSSGSGVSRRDFLKISGVSAAVPLVSHVGALALAEGEVAAKGPGKVPVSLNVNGKKLNAELEPRVTLLDALRDQFELTGAKRVCDRGTCGSCTILLDGKAVYACSVLAIDAQSHQITTVEGLGEPGKLHPIQQAFIDNDAQQCGFCTPGFVVATKAFLDQHPNPTQEQIKQGLGGNFCRCGTYAGMRLAVMQAAKTKGA